MELIVSTPCPKTWKELAGNDRVRYCGQCHLNVYNLAEMKPAEIEQLVHKTGGRLCGQLYVRKDRTATLRDCPTGRSNVVWRRIRKAAAAIAVLILGLGCRSLKRPDMSDWPQWVQAVANWVDPELPHPPLKMLGEILCIPTLPSVPPAGTGS
jgi:hypothetical protein